MTKLFGMTPLLLIAALLLGPTPSSAASAFLPDFDDAVFSNPTEIDNPWVSLPPGSEFEYEGEGEDGDETVEVTITGDTERVMGVTTLVHREKVFVDGELVEDARDFLAQDDEGNVWYFGEEVDNYEDGDLVDHDGSWLAGRNGAKPGYWMPANPGVDDRYYQEYARGEAEDEAKVVSLNTTVRTTDETYTRCLKTEDSSRLEPGVTEFKYYCKQVGNVVVEESPSEDERLELVDYDLPGSVNDDEDEDTDEDEDEDEDDDASDMRALQLRIIDLLTQLLALLRR